MGNAKEITKVDEDYTNGTSIVSEYYALQKFNQIVDTLKAKALKLFHIMMKWISSMMF